MKKALALLIVLAGCAGSDAVVKGVSDAKKAHDALERAYEVACKEPVPAEVAKVCDQVAAVLDAAR